MLDQLTALQEECWQTAEDHGFHDVGRSFGDVIALMHSELSEAFEEIRDGREPTDIYYEQKGIGVPMKPCGVPIELADLFIRLLDAAECYKIDLAAAVMEKMAYNEGRPFMHGKAL